MTNDAADSTSVSRSTPSTRSPFHDRESRPTPVYERSSESARRGERHRSGGRPHRVLDQLRQEHFHALPRVRRELRQHPATISISSSSAVSGRLSGLGDNELLGEKMALARLLYYYRLTDFHAAGFSVQLYAGASLEAGNVYARDESITGSSLLDRMEPVRRRQHAAGTDLPRLRPNRRSRPVLSLDRGSILG